MKRLTLDETWVLCLKMWKWIAKEVRADKKAGKDSVNALKQEWAEKHEFENIHQDCFFCEYAQRRDGLQDCRLCPAKRVDKDFHCMDAYECCFCCYPIAFYKKLLELNKIRLAKMKRLKEK